MYKKAKELAALGFSVFPLIPNGKLPSIKSFTAKASTDSKVIENFWFDKTMELYKNNNIGVSTSKFGDGALLVVDIDVKKGKNGLKTFNNLKAEGLDFPKTLTQRTPSNGYHLIYKVKTAVPNSVEKIGPGIDIRSKGGFILGAGSEIDGREYIFTGIDRNEVAQAPQWLIDKCNETKTEARKTKEPNKKINQKSAKARAIQYLKDEAPIAIEGQGGDQTTFKVASKLKDIGLKEEIAYDILIGHWNGLCEPPWDLDELKVKVNNAYTFSQNSIGADSPENDFEAVPKGGVKDGAIGGALADNSGNTDNSNDSLDNSTNGLNPIEKLNKEFSFVVLGGKSTILKQTGNGEVNYMTPQAFHDLLASETIQTGNGKLAQLSEVWFNSPQRKTFSSVQLVPGKDAPPDVYNLWRGFKCTPLAEGEEPTADMIKGVEMFQEHALTNICLGNKELCVWLLGYFAHLVQKPWEKPLTALVFKGKKGVGKNALIDRIGNLFNGHYLLTSNKRYLTSNFNKHLANLILFVLDEAFWSGDKQAEGILKDLITGHTHLIEHKGREMFSTANVLRVCIIGNEEWVIPASEDERRFAVFNIGDERRKDRKFFTNMRELIDDKGGNRLLLTKLLKFDLSSVDINDAPVTAGLLEQKIESLNPLHSWWFASLKDGVVLNLDFTDVWPVEPGRDQLRSAYNQYAKERGVRSWLPDAAAFGRSLVKCCPGLSNRRTRNGQSRGRAYVVPDLKTARAQFDEFIGHKIDWDDGDDNVIQMFQ